MRLIRIVALVIIASLTCPQPARAWGAYGHRMVTGDGMRALPDTLPAFLRTPEAIEEITQLAPEADRLKGAGKTRDNDLDPAHYVDIGDDGTIAGVVAITKLPPTREAYDTALRAGQPIGGHAPDQYEAGYLPYEIVDGYEQVVKDFAIWRVDSYAETHVAPADRAFFAEDRRLREVLTIRDIGYWSHFVGDASQPLHTSVHFNGWGDFPNPNGYTQARNTHAHWETDFVNAHTTPEAVAPHVRPYVPSTLPILTRVGAYLAATLSNVPTFYQLEKAGAFEQATPAGVGFTLDQLANGAAELRDLITDAYAESLDAKVGYPEISVRDVLNGVVVPTRTIQDGG